MKKNKIDHPLLFKAVMLAAGLLSGFIAARIFFTVMTVSSASMEPFVKSGDHVILSNVTTPSRGDVVAIENPADHGKLLLLRIIAAEDDTVEIRNRIIYINDKRFEPRWEVKRRGGAELPMKFSYRDNMPPVRLARNEVFLLGDNYDDSYDSRTFGRITAGSITGKVAYKF